MALVDLPGSPMAFIGPCPYASDTIPVNAGVSLDAATEAVHYVGQIQTSDGGSHTIDTTGSSSIGWRTGSTTVFADAGTTFKVGIAAVDTVGGPPARAVNSSGVITFDVSKSYTGGGLAAAAWITSVPDTGTKTIANGDLVAVGLQVTARAGVDLINISHSTLGSAMGLPDVTSFLGAVYATVVAAPNVIITFADGALGWFYYSDISAQRTNLNFNSGSATKEYGQLYNLPFPCKIHGLYCWSAIGSGSDPQIILYSDPLGTPVAEKTVSIDANTVGAAAGRRMTVLFPSPYTYTKNTDIAVVLKPTTANNIIAYSKTFDTASHRAVEMWGTSGYGVSRASGAFANINSSLDHLYNGLIVGAFDNG